MRLGVFGGTFDPVHEAHLRAAAAAADMCRLDQVLLVPAGQPPHKRGAIASYADRYRMVELACAADERFTASDLEQGMEKSYTIHTLEKLAGNELFFIIGADAFAEITSWFRWEEVVRLTQFIVISRPGHHYAVPAGARVHRLETLALHVSSSDLRQRLAAGEMPPEIPDAVAQYIRERGLYWCR